MAVNPSDFYISSTEIDSKIDVFIPGLQGKIDSIISHLIEDPVTHIINVNAGEHSQFQSKLRSIENDFKWYKQLTSTASTYTLFSAYANDYLDVKVDYTLDKIQLTR